MAIEVDFAFRRWPLPDHGHHVTALLPGRETVATIRGATRNFSTQSMIRSTSPIQVHGREYAYRIVKSGGVTIL
jgi:hypothetical protein